MLRRRAEEHLPSSNPDPPARRIESVAGMVVIRIVVGVPLLAHGLVHLLYLARNVPEFSVVSSWLVPDPARRPVARFSW